MFKFNKGNLFRIAVSSLGLCLAACSPTNTEVVAPPPAAAVTPPSPEQMQAAFKKASTPTAEHTLLKQLVGSWRATASWKMTPDAKPEVTKGYSTNTMILGGKFLRQDYRGKFMGQPFTGIGLTGFDTVLGEYTSIWVDSMSTAMMYSSGASKAGEKEISLQGSMSCPLTNGKQELRSVIKVIDSKHHVYEMYGRTPEGTEFKSLEISYVKASPVSAATAPAAAPAKK